MLIQDKEWMKCKTNFFKKVDTFMPEMDLRQSRFRYSASRPFTKKKKRKKKKTRKQKFKDTEDSGYIYQNELDKSCFQHDVVYGDFKY